jgi:hypothetical protein
MLSADLSLKKGIQSHLRLLQRWACAQKEGYSAVKKTSRTVQQTDPAFDDYIALEQWPKEVPAGYLLVHNHIMPTRHIGSRGFRAWLTPVDPARRRFRLALCGCNLAADPGLPRLHQLDPHYRVAFAEGAGGQQS